METAALLPMGFAVPVAAAALIFSASAGAQPMLHGSGVNVTSLSMQGAVPSGWAEGAFTIGIPGFGGPLTGRFDSRRFICTPAGCN